MSSTNGPNNPPRRPSVGSRFTSYVKGTKADSKRLSIAASKNAAQFGISAETLAALDEYSADESPRRAGERQIAHAALFDRDPKTNKPFVNDADGKKYVAAAEKIEHKSGNKVAAIIAETAKLRDAAQSLSEGKKHFWTQWRIDRKTAKADAIEGPGQERLKKHQDRRKFYFKAAVRVENALLERSGQNMDTSVLLTPKDTPEDLAAQLRAVDAGKQAAEAKAIQHRQFLVTQAAHKVQKRVLAPLSRFTARQHDRASLVVGPVARALSAPVWFAVVGLKASAKPANRALNPFANNKENARNKVELAYRRANSGAPADVSWDTIKTWNREQKAEAKANARKADSESGE